MKLIIAGTRNVEPEEQNWVYNRILEEISSIWPSEIIVGGCSGVDAIGRAVAEDARIEMIDDLRIRVFSADWQRYGKSAGPRRNAAMAEHGEVLIAIPLVINGKPESRGTMNMINNMIILGKQVIIIPLVRRTK